MVLELICTRIHTVLNQVLDFGLSKKFMPGSSGVMTEYLGTVYTMAPQVLNGVYDSKADCWYVTLFRLRSLDKSALVFTMSSTIL